MDNLTVNVGTFNFAGSAAGSGINTVTLGNVFIEAGTTVTVAAPDVHDDRHVLMLNSLFIAGSTNAWAGQLNLTSNDLIVHNGNLAQLTNQIASGYSNGTWTGQGVTSSTAATSPNHVTALGLEMNNNGNNQPLFGNGTALGLFDGQNPSITDVLIKYTYYGDANLDGKVDGSDYAKIDNGFLTHVTGWSNGDFNYDGTVNGSDYTLIDNAFNTQGATLAAQISSPTADATTRIALSADDGSDVKSESRRSAERLVARMKTATQLKASISSPSGMFTGVPIIFSDAPTQTVEILLGRKDLVDRLRDPGSGALSVM